MKPYNQQESKKSQVRRMFDTIAPSYDRLNHLLSFNFDRLWRRKLVRMVAAESPK
ncbi:MAG: class I SAM-dependent methyltransferase, partial [Tidjanibacter sp.]|nr:class I SAM-dependent methyltransferase [Tidjanibacter sp.]